MKSALDRFSLQIISPVLRHSRGIGMWEQIQGNQAALTETSVRGFERSDGSVRGYVATSPLFRSFISSKYSRNESKRDRKRVVKVKDEKSTGSRVRHGPNLAFKALNQTGLHDSTKAVILGSLLGDSTLRISKGEYTLYIIEYML